MNQEKVIFEIFNFWGYSETLKQKDAYPYKYMNSFERFFEEKLPDKKCFYRSLKNRTTVDNGEKICMIAMLII